MRFIFIICLTFGFALGQPTAGFAQGNQDTARRVQERGDVIPYGRIKASAERMFDGRVVGQRLRQFSQDRWVYVLRILRGNGEVISVTIDAQNGEVIGTTGRRR